MTRKNVHDISNGALLKIMAALVVIVLVVVGIINYGETGSPLSFAGWSSHSSGTQTLTGPKPGNATCPSGNPTYTFSAIVKYPSISGGQFQVNTASGQLVSFYSPGSASAQNIITSGSTPVQTASLPGNCNTVWFVDTGDNVNYFLNGTYAFIGQLNQTRSLTVHTEKISAVTMMGANVNSQGSFTTGGATLYGISSASGQQNFYFSIQSSTAGANVSLDGKPALVFVTFNSLSIPQSDISVSGLTAMSCSQGGFPTPTYATTNTAVTSLVNVGAQNNCVAFEVPEFHNNQYATTTGGTSAFTDFTLQVTPGANFNPNSLIGLAVYGESGYYNVTGASAGYTSGLYAYPTNGVAIVPSYVNSNMFILHS